LFFGVALKAKWLALGISCEPPCCG
jgi:hypothetical protein